MKWCKQFYKQRFFCMWDKMVLNSYYLTTAEASLVIFSLIITISITTRYCYWRGSENGLGFMYPTLTYTYDKYCCLKLNMRIYVPRISVRRIFTRKDRRGFMSEWVGENPYILNNTNVALMTYIAALFVDCLVPNTFYFN